MHLAAQAACNSLATAGASTPEHARAWLGGSLLAKSLAASDAKSRESAQWRWLTADEFEADDLTMDVDAWSSVLQRMMATKFPHLYS